MTTPDFVPVRKGTVSELLRTLAARRPDAEALCYPAFANHGTELRLTFRELDERVDALARGLLAAGVERGEHVALWAANVPDWIPLEYALARVGAVLVTVNTALGLDEVGYVLRQSGARTLLHTTSTGSNAASDALDALLTDDAARPPALRRRLWIPSTPDETPPTGFDPAVDAARALTPLAELVARGETLPDHAVRDREQTVEAGDVVNIQYTSGTTGFPKGVMLTHTNIVGNSSVLADHVGIGPDDRVALFVPLFHCFGCAVTVLGSHGHGAAICALPGFEPEAALRLVHDERVSIVHGVPTMFSAMLHHERRAAFDTSSLRAGICAGAPCPVPLMEQIVSDLGCAGIAVAYGLTEASPGVTGCTSADPLALRCETVGRPLPGVEVRVVDPRTRQDVPDGAEGELWCRGPNVMEGYHDDPTATAEALTADGWLRTGDLATRDDAGVLRIVGRAKDIIIRAGENVAPAEIENLLREHEAIVDVSVVGIPDERLGEEVAACVVLADDAELDEQALEAHLQGRIASFKIPRVWRAFERFPLTGSGKVQKFRLRELLAEG